MPKRLEFISYSWVRRDPRKFLLALRATYPTVSPEDLERIATAEMWKHKPRLNHTEVLLFGRDVLTDDLSTVAGWGEMSRKARRHLEQHQAAGTLSRIVSIPDLSRTYVFNKQTEWVQEVTDADAALIRQSKARTWFRDIDVYGPWPGFPQVWELPVAERFEATSLTDAAAFVKDVKQTKTWPGRG